MFILVLFFFIFTGIFTAFRFPNLTSRVASRLRLPRFNFSRAFRNPKIKALLNDRYFFNQNISKISKGPLFLVLGKNAAKLHESLLKTSDDEFQKTVLEAESSWAERGESEAFAILTFGNAHFVFVHPALCEKNFEENFNSRIRFFLKRLHKFRRQNFIDGVLITVSASSQSLQTNQKSKPSSEMLEEISYNAAVFQKLSENFKIRFPLFFIEHDFSLPEEKYFGKNHINDEINFGFFCDFLQKPYEQKHEEFLAESFKQFTSDFELNFQQEVFSSQEESSKNIRDGIGAIAIMHHVQASDASLISGYIRLCLKHFAKAPNFYPASLSILNSVLFAGENSFQSLRSIFEYIGNHGTQKVEIAPELLERRRKINIVLASATFGIVFFFSFAIVKSVQFLNFQRKSFEVALSNFNTLVDSIDSSLNEPNSEETIVQLQETSCRIIKNYAGVKKISFRTAYLFPSWKSDIATLLQQKYKDKFSLLFSNFLLEKYSNLLNEMVQPKVYSKNVSLTESFDSFKEYVNFLSSYNEIYAQLNSKKQEQINKALVAISNIIYKNQCVENAQTYDFLTTINAQKLNAFLNLHKEVQKNVSIILEERANRYFDVLLSHNALMNSFLNLNHDILEFGNLVDSMENSDDDDLLNVQLAMEKTIQDYQFLAEQFPSDKPKSLSSAKDFFGEEFSEILETVKKNTLFENASFSKLTEASQATFESFKKQIDISNGEQTKNHFPILVMSQNSELSLNPDVVRLFTALNKLDPMSSRGNPSMETSRFRPSMASRPTGSIEEKPQNNLHKTANRPILNTFWVDRKLQAAVQKYSALQEQYNSLDFELYPDTFSEYLQDYIFNSLEQYWSNALSASLEFNIESNSENTQEKNLDPYGLVSSAQALKQALEYLVAEHFENTLADFDDIYARQVDDILKNHTILFDRKELFGENANFKLWDGTTSPAFDLFHVGSDENLSAAIEKQKQILADYYAQNIERNLKALTPVMQLRPNIKSFYYNRWYSIQLALEDKSKSYQNFSNFMLEDFKKFRIDDCPSILESSRDASAVWDYFDSRIEYLYGKLNERCRTIYMQTALESYEELAKSFNSLLAGKYPFTNNSTKVDVQSADTQDVVRVLSQFQNFNKDKLSFLLKYNSQFSNRSDVQDFIAQMSKVNSFFASNSEIKLRTDEQAQDNLQIQANFTFRSRKTDEILANRVVDWELKMGDKTYGSLHGNLQNAQLVSKYGDMLRFKLSFSNEVSPKQQNIVGKNSSQIVRDNFVIYTFKDNWALFKFIDEHKTCFNATNCSKEKLKFEIPLENGGKIVLFCDLNLLNAEGKKMSLPTFPVTAPL